MKYLLLVCWDTDKMNAQPDYDPADATDPDEGFPWVDDLQAQGKWKIGSQLAAPRRARTVRRRGEKVVVTDGPFLETKEAIGGFDLIEADSMDEAVEIASRHPVAAMGAIEVRPIWDQ